MVDKVEAIIKNVLSKDRDVLVGIFKEITTKYIGETMRQHAIRAAIMKFEHDHPKVMEEFDNHMKKKRELIKNEHAADYDTDMRIEFAIPDGLETIIKQLFDKIGQTVRFLSDESEKKYKEKEWFNREFPRYKVPANF